MSDALSIADQESVLLDSSNFGNHLRNVSSSVAPSDSISQNASSNTAFSADTIIDWSNPCLRGFEPPPISHRNRGAWHWRHGFEARETESGSKFWACMHCYQAGNITPGFTWTYKDGAGNKGIRGHLKKHDWDEQGSIKEREVLKRESIIESMRKKASDSRLASEVYHQLKTSFNKELFLRKLLRWIIHNDLPFDVVDSIHFRAMMLEANSSLEDYGCLQTDETIKRTIIEDYQGYKGEVTERLRAAASKIHTSFDLWTSRNHIALCGIVVHFVDANYQMQNFLLSIPEIEGKHSGLNIAETALAILNEFDILDRLGYTVTDNASSNSVALELMAEELDFNDKHKRLRCMGHIINLIARSVLFGKDPASLQKTIEEAKKDVEQLKLWRSRGPIGKLHNVVKFIMASAQRRKRFLNIQLQEDIECFVTAAIKGTSNQKSWLLEKDNETRWNSTYKMICRAIELRNAIDAFIYMEIDAWELYEKEQSRKRARGKDAQSQRQHNQRSQRLDNSSADEVDNSDNDILSDEDLAEEQLQPQKRKRSIKKRPTIIDDALTNEDWHVLTEYKAILKPLWEATLQLEGEALEGRNGALWEVLPMYEFILDHFYELDSKYQNDTHEISTLYHASLQLGIQKADDYYKKTDESPAYLAAVILHPQYKWQYIDIVWEKHQGWIRQGKAAVQTLWETEYKHLAVDETLLTERSTKPKAVSEASGPKQWLNKHLKSAEAQIYDLKMEVDDEYAWYCKQSSVLRCENEKFNPIQWWKSQSYHLPRLAKMAVDILSTPAMSAKAERIFSHCGNIVRPNRARLKADTIGAVICLKQWDEAGVVNWFAGV